MKKYYFILLYFSVSYGSVFSQASDCETANVKAKEILSKHSPFSDADEIFNLVYPCALTGQADAENFLGILYLNGIGVESDISAAFTFIESAANKGNANAQYNLGRMYKTGVGCAIDFEQAMYWFEKATEKGHQRAAYSLGYMNYKGLGVPQNYPQALYWFERSEDPMAQHFLGLSHYLGYGTPVDETKALEILLTNDIVNSKTLLTYIQKNQRETNNQVVEAELASNTEAAASESPESIVDLEVAATTPLDDLPASEAVTPEDLQGDWVGKLIQYDWSGKKIERILPIELSFNESLAIDYVFLGQEHHIESSLQDDYLYFKTPFNFTVDKLYSSIPNELSLDYELFSMNLKNQTILDRNYLIGSVDTFIINWSEYGQPTRIILKPKGVAISEEEEVMLMALAAQEDQFIKLYPVPFTDQLTVQYQLETAANVYIELIGITGGAPTIIAPSQYKQPGDYTHTVPVSSRLQKGLYVVRLLAGNQLYTRLIIKAN